MCIRDRDHPVPRSPYDEGGELDGQRYVIVHAHALPARGDDGARRGEKRTSTLSLGERREPSPGLGHFPARLPAKPGEVLYHCSNPVSYTHLRAHETPEHLVCRLLLEKKH